MVVIGYPSGLPTKIADQAQVRTNKHRNFFVANLDTFGGNSGSPVINKSSGLVEGILVRGESDYKYNRVRGRFENNVCVDSGCRGEDVTKISSIHRFEDYLTH